jgi:hypothetical protein
MQRSAWKGLAKSRRHSSCVCGKKCDFRCLLKAQSVEFPNRMDKGCERRTKKLSGMVINRHKEELCMHVEF